MTKKIIAFIVCICLLPTAMLSAHAADSELSDAAKEAYDVLSKLGYINDDYTEDMIADMKDFTRAEFVQMAYNVFAAGYTSKEIYFHDVPATHFAAEAIASLVEMRVLSVSEDKLFYPDKPITRIEAAKILLYAIGYGDMCEVYGVWRTGVEAIASDIKLYKNVSANTYITYSDMLVMFYNAITAEIIQATGSKNGVPIYESNGETYLSAYRDIYIGKGVVTGIDGMSMYGDDTSGGRIKIGDMLLELNGVDADEFLGLEVIYFYSDNDDGTKLIWLKAKNKDDKVLFLNRYDHEPEFINSAQTLRYYDDNGVRRTVTVSKNLNLIFNGAYVTTGVNEILESDFYQIRLIKSGKNGTAYDLAIISDYENYRLIGAPDEQSIWLECCDSDLPNRNIKIDAYEKVSVVTSDGTSLKFSEISADNVISVFEAKDKSVIKMVVSSEFVSGKIDSVFERDNYHGYRIGGIEYKAYKKGMSLQCAAGDEVVFWFDISGNIATLGESKTQDKFAYLIKAGNNDNGDVKNLYVKLYTKSSGVKTYIVEDRIKIDGVVYKNMEAALGALGGFTVKPGIVAYEINGNGVLSMLDLPATVEESKHKTNDNMLVKVDEGSKGYDNRSMRLGQRTVLGSKTQFFGVPGNVNTAEDDEYSVGSASSLEFERSYTYTSYSYTLDKDYFYSDVVAINTNFNVPYWVSTYFAVTDKSIARNDNGDIVTVLEGYHGSIKKTINLRSNCDPSPDDVHPGDVISISSRIGEDVIKYKTVYCPHTDPHTHIDLNSGYATGGPYNIVGYIYDVKDKIVKISYEDNPKEWQQMLSIQNAKILIHEADTYGFRDGTLEELLTYKAAAGFCDRVLIYMVDSEVRNFVVYRE